MSDRSTVYRGGKQGPVGPPGLTLLERSTERAVKEGQEAAFLASYLDFSKFSQSPRLRGRRKNF